MGFFRKFLSFQWINLLIFASLIFCDGWSSVYAIKEIEPPPVEESPRYEPPPVHREQQPRTPATNVRWVIPAQFDAAGSFSQGLAAVKIEGKWGFIDKQGNVVISAEYDEVNRFSEEMAKVGKKIGREMRYGFIDNTGRIAIPLQFYGAESFSDGLASVTRLDSKGGPNKQPTYIDKTGRVVLQLKFKGDGGGFSHGVALIKYDENHFYNVIDKSGKVLYSIGFPSQGGLIIVMAEGMITYTGSNGYADAKTGRVVIPFGFEDYYGDVYSFSGGMASVKRNEKWGYVDKAGQTVIPCVFDYAASFNSGLAYAILNGEDIIIDETGQMVGKVKLKMDRYAGGNYRFFFSDGMVLVPSSERDAVRYGYFDKTGELVIPFQFADAADFSEGLAAVTVEGHKWGYIGKP